MVIGGLALAEVLVGETTVNNSLGYVEGIEKEVSHHDGVLGGGLLVRANTGVLLLVNLGGSMGLPPIRQAK